LNLRSGIVLVLCLSGGAATANSARVIDGDTLDLDGQRHRLFGIDAAERNQRCRDEQGLEWACAAAASAALKRLLSMGSVSCAEVPGTRDGFGRQISRCKVNGEDVAETLVRDGRRAVVLQRAGSAVSGLAARAWPMTGQPTSNVIGDVIGLWDERQ